MAKKRPSKPKRTTKAATKRGKGKSTSHMLQANTYEEVATYLLNRFRDHFALDRVEGKQPVPGRISGTSYTIDAKGVLVDGGGIMVVECRRHTTEKADQDEVGGLTWRIIDTGAAGGILVNPLGLQKGAKLVAAAKNIVSVQLDENSTNEEFIMRFLNQVFAGVKDTITFTDSATCEVIRGGNKAAPRHEEGTL
jgi:hypothetical protein